MIPVDVQQGSPEWIQVRLGLPTASNFHRLLTPKTRKPSSQATKYMHELLAERMIGEPIDADASQFMHRGTALEADAAAYYEFQREPTTPVGFILRDDRKVGCSPDRLVGEDGLLEIKAFAAANHVAALLGETDDGYQCQVQGQLWISERKWCDRCWFNPSMPSLIQRFERDEEFIGELAQAVDSFVERLENEWVELQKRCC